MEPLTQRADELNWLKQSEPILENLSNYNHFILGITGLCTIIFYIVWNRRKCSNLTRKMKLLEERLAAFCPEAMVPKRGIYTEMGIPDYQAAKYDTSGPKAFETLQNLVWYNYYNLLEDKAIKDVAAECVRNKGVGSCGPRGFYGTIDIHLELEHYIANFMGTEDCILYSSGISTMSSVIVAYCKRQDVLFCDEKLVYTTVQGITAARSKVIYFKHNDLEDLERLIAKENKQSNEKTRKFLVIEGIYEKTGKICPLPGLIDLAKKNKMRVVLDESRSFGVMGAKGRGITEYYEIDRSEVDMLVGSLEHMVPSIGGFCVGSTFIIEHQRLSGLGYCFSASLPPLLSTVSKYSIQMLDKNSDLISILRNSSLDVHSALEQIEPVAVSSFPLSPLKVFTYLGDTEAFIKKCLSKGILLRAEGNKIFLNVNVKMNKAYINQMQEIMEWACL